MTTQTLADLEPITEHVADWRTEEFQLQTEDRLVRHVVLSGDVSRNGYRYAADALQQAAELYRHKPVFLDHAPNAAKPMERSTRDLVGTVVETRFSDGRIRGDIQVLETEAGRTFLALLASETPNVGMSHVVLAQRTVDGKLIEKIHDVVSIDAVVFPATTHGLRESQAPSDEQVTLLREQLQLANQAVERLQTELDRREREQEIATLLAAADLPAYAVTPLFREQLTLAADVEQRQQLIAERRELVRRTEPASVISRPRQSPSRHTDDRAFLRAVKGTAVGVLSRME